MCMKIHTYTYQWTVSPYSVNRHKPLSLTNVCRVQHFLQISLPCYWGCVRTFFYLVQQCWITEVVVGETLTYVQEQKVVWVLLLWWNNFLQLSLVQLHHEGYIVEHILQKTREQHNLSSISFLGMCSKMCCKLTYK